MNTTPARIDHGFGQPSSPFVSGGMNATSSVPGFGQPSRFGTNGGKSTTPVTAGFGSNTQQTPPINGNTGNAKRDITSFFSQMSSSTRPTAPSQNRPTHPLPPKPTVNANEVNNFFSQTGTGSRPPSQKPGQSHAHSGAPNGFNPPTAPAAMRSNGTGYVSGSTTYSHGSVQWRANPNWNSNQLRAPGSSKIATSLPNGWYR